MIRNYFKVAFRNILRQKGYSFINVVGLSLGMTCCLLMLLWISDEMSFDKFHQNAGYLYRVEQDQPTPQGPFHVNICPFPMGPALKAEIPEFKNVSRYAKPRTLLLRYGDKVFFENNVAAVDPSFLEMFSFPLVEGNVSTALDQPFSLVITEEIATKYFGSEDPLGRTITVNNNYPCTVTGVIRNIPLNSTVRPSMLVPMEIMRRIGGYVDTWGSNQIVTWVQVQDNRNVASISKKIFDVYWKNIKGLIQNPSDLKRGEQNPVQFTLMKLSDIRLHRRFGYGQGGGGYQTVIIFFVMALFILLIACINFMNLATARSANRAKEVGLRKTVGATRGNIAAQFYGESILTTAIALFFAVMFVELLLPVFNTLSGKQLSTMAPFTMGFLPVMAAVAFITGIISGTYPALFLSKFHPIQVLRGTPRYAGKGSLFRKILVVFQFSLSVILIAGTFILYRQLHYMQNKKLGYDSSFLIYLPLQGDTPNTYGALKDELLKDPRILGVTGTLQTPTFMSANGGGVDWDGKDPNFNPMIGYGVVDFDYVETMKIELAEGRSFSKAFATDTSTAVLVNEEVVKLMGVTSAVGKRFAWGSPGTIIGVMKNYHYQPVQFNIEPLAVFVQPRQVNFAVVRLQAGDMSESLDRVRTAWQRVNPLYPFEYTFFDQNLADTFQDDRRMAAVFQYAALFAIAIACLGLFGLASFMIDLRTKEIGIRKTLGASIPAIASMLSKEFIRWIVIANIIAAPVAYYIMKELLMNYAYRISIGWWMFVGTAVLTLIIGLLTVGYQSIRAARSNPIDSLRYE
ncbi:MAG: ABC transporter permease [Bacteroidota bacterium]